MPTISNYYGLITSEGTMFHKVKDVIPLENYILSVSFENGEVKQYDIKKVFHK